MNVKEINVNKVIDKMNEEQLWDDMYIQIAEDSRGDTFAICEDWDDHNKFINVVKDVLGVDKDDFNDWDVEKETGIIMVFSDEYTTCSDCGNVIRTEPNSYHWQPDFYVGDGFIACNDCFNNTEDYQEAYIAERVNNPKHAINGLLTEQQIENLGFERVGREFEDGWHHVNDDPQAIYDELSERYEEVLFYINNVEQFGINFIVFVRGEIDESI